MENPVSVADGWRRKLAGSLKTAPDTAPQGVRKLSLRQRLHNGLVYLHYYIAGRELACLGLALVLYGVGSYAAPIVRGYLPSDVRLIHLRNGNVLYGKIAHTNNRAVAIDVPDIGVVSFPRTDIVAIRRVSHREATAGQEQPSDSAKRPSIWRLLWDAPLYEHDATLAHRYLRLGQPREAKATALRALTYYQRVSWGKRGAQQMQTVIRESQKLATRQRLAEQNQPPAKRVDTPQRQQAEAASTGRVRKSKIELAAEAHANAIEQASVGLESGAGKTVTFQQLPVCHSYSVDLKTGEPIKQRIPCQ